MEETRYFKKIFELSLKLQNSTSGMTKREIADFLGCSLRTVERKMEELELCFGDAFIKTDSYPKTYKIRSKYLSKGLPFSSKDFSGIYQAAEKQSRGRSASPENRCRKITYFNAKRKKQAGTGSVTNCGKQCATPCST